MGFFRLTKKRAEGSDGQNDVAVTEETAVGTSEENGSVRISEQRKTQISITIGDEREITVNGGSAVSEIRAPESPAKEITVPAEFEDIYDEPIDEEIPDDPIIVTDGEPEKKEPEEKKKEPVKAEEPPVTEDKPVEKIAEVKEEKPPVKTEKKAPANPVQGEKVGTIYGNVGTNSFECRVCAHLERSEYVMVNHEDYGLVLCQVGNLIRKSNLSLEKSLNMPEGMEIKDTITAHIDVIGYRDERNLLLTPRTTFMAGSDVLRADENLIRKVLGLEINPRTDAYIGILHGHGIKVALNINELLQRHACILAKTGGGKSYMSGDIIEELMAHNVTSMIIDPHGEYGAMREAGKPGDPKFGVKNKGFKSNIREFAVSNDSGDKSIKPLKFSFATLDAKEILELMKTKDARSFLPPLKRALETIRARKQYYSVRDLIDEISADPDVKNPAIVGELEYIEDMNVFAAKGNAIDQLIEQGKTTIINLKGVSPDVQQLIVKRLATVAFELRKRGIIPPMMMVLEEAHNYCPQANVVLSSKPLATIASEGRKFGLGLMVISQRPAKIDKNVLSQCGTQIILKVTNPNDVKAIAQSIEGLTNGMTDDIQTMPIGMAMVVGAGIETPLLVEVRPRMSRHGGSGVKVLEDSD